MFHPLWDDVGGQTSSAKEVSKKEHCKLCGKICELCGHSSVVHRANGTCHAANCLCGWSKDMKGALYVKSTGEYAGEVNGISRRRNKGVHVSTSKRKAIFKDPCYFCGGEANTIDHMVARARGGTSDPSNLVPACAVCNCMKSDKSYDELIAFCNELQCMILRKNGLKAIQRFNLFKAQGQKILAWHEKRMARPKSQGPEYLLP